MTRDRLVFKTALSLVTIGTSGLIRLVFSILVGRVFGAPLLGHVNLIISSAVFATLLCSPGIGQSVAREMASRGIDVHSAQGRSLLTRSTMWHHGICAAVAVVTGVLVPGRGWWEHVIAAALTFSYGAYTYYKAVLYGVDLVTRYVRLELVWDAVFVAVLTTVVVLDARPWILAPMVVVYFGFSVGAHRVLFGFRPTGERPARGLPGQWQRMAAFAAVTTVGTASSAGFLQLSQVFASRAEPGHGAGLFAAAMALVTPAYLLPRAISVVLFPAMARAVGRDDRATVTRQLTIGTDVLAAGLLPAFAFAGMVSTTLLRLFYGPSFADGGQVFVVMAWATWVSIASVPSVNALSSDRGRAYLVPAAASLAGFLIGLVLWVTLGTSILMVAWGYLVGSVVQSAVPMVEAWRRHGVPGGWLAVRIVVVGGACLVVGLRVAEQGLGIQVAASVLAALIAAVAVFPELRALARTRRLAVA